MSMLKVRKGARTRSLSESDSPCRFPSPAELGHRPSLRKFSLNFPHGDLASILCALSLNDSRQSADCSNHPPTSEYAQPPCPRLEFFVDLALRSLRHSEESICCRLLEQGLILGERNYAGAVHEQELCVSLLANCYVASSYQVDIAGDIVPNLDAQRVELLQSKLNRFGVTDQLNNDGLSRILRRFPGRENEGVDTENRIVSIVGKAVRAFQNGEFRTSLEGFKKVLVHNPRYCGAELRMAIGHCHIKLGSLNSAFLAYQKSLKMDSECVGALLGIAYYYLHDENDDSVNKAFQYAAKAYRLDPCNAAVSELLSNGQREPDFLPSLMHFLQNVATGNHIVADLLYDTAKKCFEAKLLDEASKYYQLSTQFGEADFILPQCGLGQIYLERGDISNAIRCFEVVCSHHKDPVVMKVLGILYKSSKVADSYSKSAEYLEGALAESPDDFNVLMQLAEVHENDNEELALKFYLQALNICEKTGHVPLQLYVNISALCATMQNYCQSEHYLNLAKDLINCASPKDIPDGVARKILKFNEAVLCECMGKLTDACCLYESILGFPGLEYDCYVQLGRIAVKEGNVEHAREWFNAASAINPDKFTAQICCSRTHIMDNNFLLAETVLHEVIKNPLAKSDTYFLLEYGNYYLERLQVERIHPKDRKVFAEKAFSLFRQVLVIDPKNVYAMNGLGSVLSGTGFAAPAAELFSAVVNDCRNVVDFLINIGHSYCEQHQYSSAVDSYQNARSVSTDASLDRGLLLYIARAYFLSKNWTKASSTLQLLRLLDPRCPVVQYDLAMTYKHFSVQVLKYAASTFADIVAAVERLKYSQTILQRLQSEVASDILVNHNRIDKALESCKDYINQSGGHLTRALETERDIHFDAQAVLNDVPLPDIRILCPMRKDHPSGGLQGIAVTRVNRYPQDSNKKRSSGYAKLDDPTSEENHEIVNVLPEAEVEPQRKRARAVDIQTRRQRKVADRKRREQEIEKFTVSSDEENVAALRQQRRKAGRTEEYGIQFRRDRNTFRRPRSPVAKAKRSPAQSTYADLADSVGSHVNRTLSSNNQETATLVTLSTEEDISTSSIIVSSKPVSSDTPPSDDNLRRPKAAKILRGRAANAPASQYTAALADKRSLLPEADDKLKRFISECEDSSRKRLSTA